MEKQYFTSVLESCTEDQWHPLEAIYITEDEAKMVIEALKEIIKNRGIPTT